ncbi:hypothetical protein FACS1894158_05990 [Betaproteobacteria bacterium]|nr:hypothetical protein FACS1894158_05990 [Betaproteobacteria bacterium]
MWRFQFPPAHRFPAAGFSHAETLVRKDGSAHFTKGAIMANNYYDATGVLVLSQVTPVIKALFGAFHLDETYPGDGQAYIARISESNNPLWDDVQDGLADLAVELGLYVFQNRPERRTGNAHRTSFVRGRRRS